MGFCEFSPHGNKSVIVSFVCDKCENNVTSEEIGIPSPNFEAEKASDSYGDNFGYAVCEKCGKDFTVSVYAGWADGYIDIDDVDDESISIESIVDEDELDYYMSQQIETIIQSANFIVQFSAEIENLKNLNDIDLKNVDLQETLQRQIYSGVITCLEDYLSTTLIQKVLNDDDDFKQFVKTFKSIKNRKFDLSEIYEKMDGLQDIVKKELVEVIYHDLPKVRGMYKDTLGIEFPKIEDLMKIVNNRHDMVHRNGKNKDGEKIEISREVVAEVINKVDNFVKEVENQLNKNDESNFEL
jgi:hypothetical protein